MSDMDTLVMGFRGLAPPDQVRRCADLMEEAHAMARTDPRGAAERLEVARHALRTVVGHLDAMADPVESFVRRGGR